MQSRKFKFRLMIALNLLLMRHREPTKVAIFDTLMGCRKLPAVTSWYNLISGLYFVCN